MKKRLIILTLTILFSASLINLASAGAARGIGSDKSCHNFSHKSWLPVFKICVTCHVPHKRGQKVPNGLPWNREIYSASFPLYNSSWSSSFTGERDLTSVGQISKKYGYFPDGTSKICLGCHDGIIATNVFKLHHFVSMEYDITKTQLRDPDQNKIGISGPISEVLESGKVQCTSCHDVHDEETFADTKLLRAPRSVLCTNCHIK